MTLKGNAALIFIFTAACDTAAITSDAGLVDAGSAPDAGSIDAASAIDAGEPVDTIAIDPLAADTCASRPTDYGAFGSVTRYRRYELPNPAWSGGDAIVVFAPESESASRPVIFFSHPFGGVDPSHLLRYFEMLVSHDVIVVFVPYPTAGMTICERYGVLEGGFDEAVRVLEETVRMDLTRVGYVGHSFGGGATAAMAHHGIVERGWGSAGSFALASAPWFAFQMDDAAWTALSAATRFTVMVYYDDPVNDHRIAIEEQYDRFSGTKAYLRLRSSANRGCTLEADHGVPRTDSGVDALDAWGLWRHTHALLECTLRGDDGACAIADGTDPTSGSMGVWLDDDTNVLPLERLTAPEPVAPSDTYAFPITRTFECGDTGTE